MEKELVDRAKALLQRGNSFQKLIGGSQRDGNNYWYSDAYIPEIRSWLDSVFNLFRLITTPDMHFHEQIIEVSKHENLKSAIPFWAVQRLCGSLASLIEEIDLGLLKKAEYIFTANVFDEFLDHSEHFQKSGKKIESSVLASIVFEDTVRKISEKNDASSRGLPMDRLIDDLVKKHVWNGIKGKRVKSYAALRNSALHANWDEFELRDVAELIKGTRELLERDLL